MKVEEVTWEERKRYELKPVFYDKPKATVTRVYIPLIVDLDCLVDTRVVEVATPWFHVTIGYDTGRDDGRAPDEGIAWIW